MNRKTRGRCLDLGIGAGVGATTAVGLWGIDCASLQHLEFAGARDVAAQVQIVRVARAAIQTLELELCIMHALVGACAGLLAYAALDALYAMPGHVAHGLSLRPRLQRGACRHVGDRSGSADGPGYVDQ